MLKRHLLALSIPALALTLALPLHARQGAAAQATPTAAAPEYGPPKGTLVIVGGAMSENFGVLCLGSEGAPGVR